MNSSNNITKEDIQQWVQPVVEKENLKNYKINISGTSEKGDGYLGDVTFVTITGLSKSGEVKEFKFVIKSGKPSKKLRVLMPIRKAFKNEIYVYEEVLPIFEQFQAERKVETPFNNNPPYYHSRIEEDMEVLILQNMKELGFYLFDRKKPMTKDHIRAVIKVYGKLHALSFALRDQKPEVFGKLTEKFVDILKIMSENYDSTEPATTFNDAINIAKKRGKLELAEKTEILQSEAIKMHQLSNPLDPYAVIVHGDCWNNNFMFSYKDKEQKEISKVCLLDMQISRLASPVLDLSYFLFTCISPEDVCNFDEINDIYYESLSNFLRELGSDPDKLFPYEELGRQWKKYARFGLIMMPSLLKICLSDPDEITDLAEVADADIKLKDAFQYSIKDIKEYERRILPVLQLASDKEFI